METWQASKELGAKLCESLGLDPKMVKRLEISIDPYESVVRAELIPPLKTLETAQTVLREYTLVKRK